jgi:hypothetical protein
LMGAHHLLVAATSMKDLRPQSESRAALCSHRSSPSPKEPNGPHLAILAAVFEAEGAATAAGEGSGGGQWDGAGGGGRFEMGGCLQSRPGGSDSRKR